MNNISVTERQNIFHHLHTAEKVLLLPNIWDPLGAALLEKLGYPAVATSSSAMSLSNGYRDGEKLPFTDLLHILKRITATVNIPMSADIETAYARNNSELKENILKLTDTGISGINYEDSKHGESKMISISEQSEKISLIRKTVTGAGSRIFINARIDVYIKGNNLSDGEKLEEAIKRGKAYKEAGADGLYPILLKNKEHIKTIKHETGLPLNITFVDGIPDVDSIKSIGVDRISLASGFLKSTIYHMKDVAEKLLKQNDTTEIIRNMVSSEYLSELISDKQANLKQQVS